MTTKTLPLTDELHAYVVAHATGLDDIANELIAETHTALARVSTMQVAPEQAVFLRLLTGVVGARHAVEVGTFTGLSALAIARGLTPGGRLTCFDISEEYTSVARRYWARAGVDDRIDLRIGPAIDGLAALPTEPHVDFSFIDADKTEYPRYWAEIVPRTRPGGLIVVDNVLRGGRVVDPAADDLEAHAVVAFNDLVFADERVESVMLPLADGITIARRR